MRNDSNEPRTRTRPRGPAESSTKPQRRLTTAPVQAGRLPVPVRSPDAALARGRVRRPSLRDRGAVRQACASTLRTACRSPASSSCHGRLRRLDVRRGRSTPAARAGSSSATICSSISSAAATSRASVDIGWGTWHRELDAGVRSTTSQQVVRHPTARHRTSTSPRLLGRVLASGARRHASRPTASR